MSQITTLIEEIEDEKTFFEELTRTEVQDLSNKLEKIVSKHSEIEKLFVKNSKKLRSFHHQLQKIVKPDESMWQTWTSKEFFRCSLY